MPVNSVLDEQDVAQLKEVHYNAQLVDVIPIHDDLRILRVRPDAETCSFSAGQYTVLGLGNWEPRVPGVQLEEPSATQVPKLLKRAYSFSCPIWGDNGRLSPPHACEFLEFYVVLIRRGEEHPPGLTPRLFVLAAGDRLFVGSKATGHYTLAGVQPDDNVIFVGTGTGEAPHNAMLAELLSRGHSGRLLCLTCVRYAQDLGYLAAHRQLEERYSNYRYLTLTTREPENLDAGRPDYVGKRYVQELFESGDIERMLGQPLDPVHTHVFLCGNPAMIGAPLRNPAGVRTYPQPPGMVEVLEGRGLRADEPGHPGNIHFEKYW